MVFTLGQVRNLA